MKYELIVRPRAENHITEITLWYDKRRKGLGYEFLLSFEACLQSIKNTPLVFQLKFKKVRIAYLKRFPYGIFYFVDNTKIVVIAVFHLKRNPRSWNK